MAETDRLSGLCSPESAAVTLRPARPEDAEALLEIYRPYVEKTAVSFEYKTPTPEEFRHRIAVISEKYPYLLAQDGNRVLGYAYANTFKGRCAYDWAVETTVYIRQDARRRGIGSLLYRGLEVCLTAQGILNLNACIACPREENDPYLTRDSENFHARLGFVPVGVFHNCGCKFGRWYHMIWMEKEIGEHRDFPQPIRRFPELPVENLLRLL